ncbi:MAG: Hydrolase, haloacid dehalogenase-like family [Edaphobacter sp.]|nr:Hydrolase, haloacid dehalogenase-like family [Edaphobacter sp.]
MTAHTILDRPWDGFDAYLFDIDGTLLHCSDAVHYFAFCDALKALSGNPLTLEGVTAHGNTDVGILRDALALAGVADAEWRPRVIEIRTRMCRFVETRKDELCAAALPCVREVLAHLEGQDATLGIVTGNLKDIGRMKLQHAGLLDYFNVFGWSDDFEYRVDVFRSAVEQIRAAMPLSARICAVGDTPADVLAARANGLPVIAVATGVYSREQLLTEEPDLCLESFEELFRAA